MACVFAILIPVHRVSEIFKQLDNVQPTNSSDFELWKSQISEAVLSGNTAYYHSLIKESINQPPDVKDG